MKLLKRRSRSMIIVLLCVMLSACGCQSLVKKFVREPKKQEQPMSSMVLSPEMYPDSQANKEDTYRHYLAVWGGWHDVLIDTLGEPAPHMRRLLDSIQEAIRNLSEMQKLLTGDKQTETARYLVLMTSLKERISKDIYGNNMSSNRAEAESLKRQISGALHYERVKDFLK